VTTRVMWCAMCTVVYECDRLPCAHSPNELDSYRQLALSVIARPPAAREAFQVLQTRTCQVGVC
jgi:hypothetical protein